MANMLLRDGAIQLRDGRSLAYCEWGQPEGPVVLAFHGSPGSRLWWPDGAGTAAPARLVTVDRPGYGRSDPMPGRSVVGWVADVADLTDALGIERFGVVGWSGGAPYAAAVAARMPQRLTGVCLASSDSLTYILASTERDEEDLENLEAIERDGAHAATVASAEKNRDWADEVATDPVAYVVAGGTVGPGDRQLFVDSEFVEGFATSVKEGLRQGALGAATDWVALVAPWGFELDDISIHCDLWLGEQDAVVDRAAFEAVATGLPDASLTLWPDAGHFGPAGHWADVLAAALG